ncbi:MAG TPA: tetratricopeptide repeat protein [Polyangia bacterium]|nr:tetratricopeptide repeat protein [Polyangia bacterium]
MLTLVSGAAAVFAARTVSSAGASCFPTPPTESPSLGPGLANPFQTPDPQATALNAEAKAPYRQGQWEQARKLYRQALAVDPTFLAPRLNIACSFVRQERFDEAATEVAQLLGIAYVPWAREIREAADLGALKTRPEMAKVQSALTASAQRWSANLSHDLVFIARLRPALRIPESEAGVFILAPHQELFAWSPVTNRYRQLTSDDGRVLAMVVSSERRHVLYITAEKLVRDEDGRRPPALRGLNLRRLDLTSMAEAEPVAIPGDVTRLEMIAGPGGTFSIQVAGDAVTGAFALRAATGPLIPGAPRPPDGRAGAVVLAAAAASGPRQVTLAGACPLVAQETKDAAGMPRLEIRARGRQPLLLAPTLGASLSVLPLLP